MVVIFIVVISVDVVILILIVIVTGGSNLLFEFGWTGPIGTSQIDGNGGSFLFLFRRRRGIRIRLGGLGLRIEGVSVLHFARGNSIFNIQYSMDCREWIVFQ